MIVRLWRGWTTAAKADEYEALLLDEILPGIQNRLSLGFRGIHLLRRDSKAEVEFVMIIVFDSLDAVRAFAGDEFERALVPEKARALLAHYDACAEHYDTITKASGAGSGILPSDRDRVSLSESLQRHFVVVRMTR